MIKTSSKTLFTSIMMASSILVLSSSNWLNMWMGMEMNMMAFIPLMYSPKNNFLSQSSMMYFLTQSMSSTMFIIFMLKTNFLTSNMEWKETTNMIMLSMMIKMGMPPFHMWYPEMMNKMSWIMCLILSTWQKLAPMYVCSQTMTNTNMSMMMIMLSTMMGAILGLNQTSMRKIMSYSSMNHMGWMMACMLMYKKSWMMYMMIYTMMMLLLCKTMHEYNIMYINQFSLKSMSMTEKMLLMSLMLSMGGLPPFLGFLPKWITIENMINSNEMVLLIMMMWSSLLTLSYYMRMTSSTNLMMSHSQKWMNIYKTKKPNLSKTMYINLMIPMLILSMNFM